MGFRYKDGGKAIIKKLNDAGYNTGIIRSQKLISEGTLQKLRNDKMISLSQIDNICKLLSCHPSEIIEYYID